VIFLGSSPFGREGSSDDVLLQTSKLGHDNSGMLGSMRLTKLTIAFCVMFGAIAVTRPSSAQRNMTPVAYFLEQMPSDIDAPRHLPSDAKDVITAKVRFGQDSYIAWLGGRHCEGCTNDIFGSRMTIVEVLAGSAKAGEIISALFGQRSENREFLAYPSTPDQRSREYTVVSYLGEDGKRRLVPFQISHSEYQKWREEMLAYQRLLGTRPP
jgi:hypothetical protein